MIEKNKQLIDFSQLAMSALTATFKPNDVLNKSMIKNLTLDSIRFNVLKFRQQYPEVIIAVDKSNNGYWRRDVFPMYKKHRSLLREKSNFDFDLIFETFHELVDDLTNNFPYYVISIDKLEADDIIAVLTNRFKDDCDILINATDGDFTQLHEGGSVKQWSSMLKKWVIPKHGSPKKDLIYKIIKGDEKDTIAPIKCPANFIYDNAKNKLNGIQCKRAPSVFQSELDAAYNAKDLHSLYEGEQLQRLIQNESILDLSKIPEIYVSKINNMYDNYTLQPRRKLYPYFIKNRMPKLAQKISDF